MHYASTLILDESDPSLPRGDCVSSRSPLSAVAPALRPTQGSAPASPDASAAADRDAEEVAREASDHHEEADQQRDGRAGQSQAARDQRVVDAELEVDEGGEDVDDHARAHRGGHAEHKRERERQHGEKSCAADERRGEQHAPKQARDAGADGSPGHEEAHGQRERQLRRQSAAREPHQDLDGGARRRGAAERVEDVWLRLFAKHAVAVRRDEHVVCEDDRVAAGDEAGVPHRPPVLERAQDGDVRPRRIERKGEEREGGRQRGHRRGKPAQRASPASVAARRASADRRAEGRLPGPARGEEHDDGDEDGGGAAERRGRLECGQVLAGGEREDEEGGDRGQAQPAVQSGERAELALEDDQEGEGAAPGVHGQQRRAHRAAQPPQHPRHQFGV
mmetsp:Transcript_46168/g.150118  ORF Transcript_46168/g.150118 Transcript_46168/m.150118 type:complete len:392 (+) Transcript_46168:176-1351(+)